MSLQDGSRARPEGWAGRGGVERAGCTAGGGKEEEPGGTLGRQGTELRGKAGRTSSSGLGARLQGLALTRVQGRRGKVEGGDKRVRC